MPTVQLDKNNLGDYLLIDYEIQKQVYFCYSDELIGLAKTLVKYDDNTNKDEINNLKDALEFLEGAMHQFFDIDLPLADIKEQFHI